MSTTCIVSLYCCILCKNASQNEASPSVINNVGHVRGLKGSSYISFTAIQISKLFLDVNKCPALKCIATSITRKLQTNTFLPSWLSCVWSKISYWWTLFGILIFEKPASALHGNGLLFLKKKAKFKVAVTGWLIPLEKYYWEIYWKVA